jgi:hypothetical protein
MEASRVTLALKDVAARLMAACAFAVDDTADVDGVIKLKADATLSIKSFLFSLLYAVMLC